jgi:hypothetical protein
MDKKAFIHVIRAAASVVEDELIVVGSQAILGTIDDPPQPLVRSLEVDLYPRTHLDRAIEIDGALGDGSPFHEHYGYYAHAVGPETITAPAGWEARLKKVEVPAIRRKDGTAIGWCLSVPDLMLAKVAAGRPQDVEFVEAALTAGVTSADELRLGVDLLPEPARPDARTRVEGVIAKVTRSG